MYWHKTRLFVEKFGYQAVMKKVIPLINRHFKNFCQPAKKEILHLIIEIMKMPHFDVHLEMCDFIMKNLVQSRCAKDRQMFLELASLAVDEFSCESFKRFFGEFIFFFA